MNKRLRFVWALSLLMFGLTFISLGQDSTVVLTSDNSVKTMARVSEDGQFVAYVGDKTQDNECTPLAEDNQEIFMATSDGQDVFQLTDNDLQDTDPSISADGGMVAFAREVNPKSFAVFVVDTFSTSEMLISATTTQSGSSTISAIRPMISANGEMVVYEERGDIFVARSDGSTPPTNLTDSTDIMDSFPKLNEDGTQIVFSSVGDYLGTNPTGDEEIFAITSFGTNLRQLTRNEVPDLHPWISSDGLFVAFERGLPGQQPEPNAVQYDVFLIPSNGSAFETNLTNTGFVSERFPSLNRSATKVVFEHTDEKTDKVTYIRMNTDGTEQITIADAPDFPIDGVAITLTEDGELAAFSGEADGRDCVQIVISGTPPNISPLANGGGDQTAGVGDVVELDGTSSNDPNGDDLNYTWEIVSKPDGSTAEIDDPNSPNPSFEVDVAGEYLINLVVDDGREGIDSDKINILVDGEGGQDDSMPSNGTSVENALDGNTNSIIDDDEIEQAITFWVLGEPLPDSGGLIIGDDKITELIELWVLGVPIDEVAE